MLEKGNTTIIVKSDGLVCRRAADPLTPVVAVAVGNVGAAWRGPLRLRRLAGWEISIDSRRQKRAISPIVLPFPSPSPRLSLSAPLFAVVLPPWSKVEAGKLCSKLQASPFGTTPPPDRHREGTKNCGLRPNQTNEQWQNLKISASLSVVSLS